MGSDRVKISFMAGGQSLSDPAQSEWLQQLADAVRSSGLVELVSPRDPSSQLFVALDLNARALFQSLLWQNCERVLFLAEPRVIRPLQFLPLVLRLFNRVFFPSPLYRTQAGQRVGDLFRWSSWWPQSKPAHSLRGVRKAGAAMIAGDKFSFVPGQQYELRRRVIESWSSSVDFPLAVAGTGWFRAPVQIVKVMILEALRGLGSGHPPAGFIRSLRRRLAISGSSMLLGDFDGHQVDFLRDYEYALVIENEPTIVTEKFWQAIEASCIPIYFGPDLAAFGLPSNVAIQMKTVDELLAFRPGSLSKSDKLSIRNSGAELLKSSTEWTFHYSAKDIASKVTGLLRTQS